VNVKASSAGMYINSVIRPASHSAGKWDWKAPELR
jgi:hypothetical protein